MSIMANELIWLHIIISGACEEINDICAVRISY